MSTTIKEKPNIFEYLSFRDFLNDLYLARKNSEENFSYASWARELGFESRSFLRMICVGQRVLNEPHLQRLLNGLNLGAKEAQYFENLVRFTQARTISERERHAQHLGKIGKKHSPKEVRDVFEFLSSYHSPKVQTLLSMGEPRSTQEIAAILDLQESQVASILQNLASINFVKQTSGQKWMAVSDYFSVPTKLNNIALQSFHKKSLEDAIKAIDMPAETRRYTSLLLHMSETNLGKMQLELQEHFDKLVEKYSQQSQSDSENKIYQINFNIIPVSKAIPRTKKQIRSAPIGLVDNSPIKEIEV